LLCLLTTYQLGKCHCHCLNQGWPKATKATRARRQAGLACSVERTSSSAVQHRVAWRGAQALSKGCFKALALSTTESGVVVRARFLCCFLRACARAGLAQSSSSQYL